MKEQLINFLLDKKQMTTILSAKDSYNYGIMKLLYDKETDFIYILNGYRSHPANFSSKADFEGIVSYKNKKIYPFGYHLSSILPDQKRCSYESLKKTALEMVQKQIEKRIDNNVNNLSAFENSDELEENIDYYKQYELDKQVWEHFFNGIVPEQIQYKCYWQYSFSAEDIIYFMNNPNEFAKKFARQYIDENSADIYQIFLKNNLLAVALQNLIKDKTGIHNIHKAVYDAITDQKKVNVEILKEGQLFQFKYEAQNLKWSGKQKRGDFSTWHMDASFRQTYKDIFGHDDPKIFEIQKITHGRKTLYDKEKFTQAIKENRPKEKQVSL